MRRYPLAVVPSTGAFEVKVAIAADYSARPPRVGIELQVGGTVVLLEPVAAEALAGILRVAAREVRA